MIKSIDDPVDRAAVELGIDLWDQSAESLSFASFVQQVRVRSRELNTRRPQ